MSKPARIGLAEAKRSRPAAREGEGITRFLLVLPMLGGVFLSRFGLPVFQIQLLQSPGWPCQVGRGFEHVLRDGDVKTSTCGMCRPNWDGPVVLRLNI